MPAKPALLLILPVLLLPLQAAAIILDCEVNVDGTYTCIEIHGTVVTEEARNKAKQEQQKYYQQAQDKCEYREPRRRPVGKSSSALRMEDLKRAQAEYEACVARKAEEMRKADQTDTQ
jgi:hypothetical protein